MIPETPPPRPRSGRAVRPHERRRLVTEMLQLDAKSIKDVLKGPAGQARVLGWVSLEDRLGVVFLPGSPKTPRGVALVPVPRSVPLNDTEAVWEAMVPRVVDSPLIPIRATRPHFGGERLWLVCPCDRKVRILYRPAHRATWACRTCWGLTYESRRLHRNWWYQNLDLPELWMKRNLRDLESRSARRKLRAMMRIDPWTTCALIERLAPELRGEG